MTLEWGVRWKTFKIDDLFDIHSSVKKFNANSVKFGGKYPYVVRGTSSNGIRGYINNNEMYLNPANTISFGQDTATIYYQDAPYFTGDKIKIFELRDKYPKLNAKIAQFLIIVMDSAFQQYKWGQQSFSVDDLKLIKIELPVTDIDQIDFDFMQTYISAIEKESIKDVITYKDKVISTTKNIVNNDH